jgi:hypothetical protein
VRVYSKESLYFCTRRSFTLALLKKGVWAWHDMNSDLFNLFSCRDFSLSALCLHLVFVCDINLSDRSCLSIFGKRYVLFLWF